VAVEKDGVHQIRLVIQGALASNQHIHRMTPEKIELVAEDILFALMMHKLSSSIPYFAREASSR
jgi:hypothetical protein